MCLLTPAELECDALCKEKILHRVLRNINSQLLVVRPDLNLAAFEDVTDQEMQSGNFQTQTITPALLLPPGGALVLIIHSVMALRITSNFIWKNETKLRAEFCALGIGDG